MTETSIAKPDFFAHGPKRLFIGGEWVDSDADETITSVNPSTGEPLVDFAAGTAGDVNRAVVAAREAFGGPWGDLRAFDRQRLILRLAELVDRDFDELTAIDVYDMGMPYTQAKVWRDRLQAALHYYAGMAIAIHGETLSNSIPRELGMFHTETLREPIGIVGALMPFNAPRWQVCRKIGPALATGCTLVLKPSEEASLCALKFAELVQEAEIPDGVINVVTGYGAIVGSALVEHPDVDMIAFTGGVQTGQRVLQAATANVKRVTLELGGKSPTIVFSDADLETAIPTATLSAFANNGQVCHAGTRLFVDRAIHEAFLERLIQRTSQLRLGASMDAATDVGPIISSRQRDRVLGMLVEAERDTRVLIGGSRTNPELHGGFFINPTVLGDVSDDAAIARDEVFGPILSTFVFDSIDELVARANGTRFGLAANIWTRDIGKAYAVGRAIRAGTIWINTWGHVDPAVPFGGYRMSGLGREGGSQHVEDWLEVKSLYIRTN